MIRCNKKSRLPHVVFTESKNHATLIESYFFLIRELLIRIRLAFSFISGGDSTCAGRETQMLESKPKEGDVDYAVDQQL